MPTVRLLACGFVFWLAAGCGPMQAPLPPRLNDDDQKSVNDAWEKALTPVGRHDNQTLLDLLIVTRAYQVGVDRLEFRSEKTFSGGKVIMEVRYDRSSPGDDLFELRVVDDAEKVVRRERYQREQIERTNRELLKDADSLRKKKEQGTAKADELHRLTALEARWAVVESIFPKRDEK